MATKKKKATKPVEEEAVEEEEDWGTAEEEEEDAPDATVGTAPDEEPDEDEWGAEEDASMSAPTLEIESHQGVFDVDTTKIMVYGESGTGKTRFAATFPKPIFIDIDHGMSSVTKKVDKFTISEGADGLAQLRGVVEYLRGTAHGYETVVVDTLNEMQRVIMNFTIEEFTHIKRSYGNLPGMSDYGYMLNQFMSLTREIIALPMRVVLLAQTNSQQFDTDILMPQLVGKNSARDLSRKMDVIGYIFKTESETSEGLVPSLTFDSIQHVTKDRSDKLPSLLDDPSYKAMNAFWD